jgi:hypothetical protein
VTDFYADNAYPVYLIYNPYNEGQKIKYSTGNEEVDLFDLISKSYLAKSVDSETEIEIPADQAIVVLELPSGTNIQRDGERLLVNGKIISHK